MKDQIEKTSQYDAYHTNPSDDEDKMDDDLYTVQETQSEQIVLLTNENNVLKSKLRENDSALRAIGIKLENAYSTIKDYEEFSSTSPTLALTGKTSLASKKIIELSKKVRELTAETESYKSKCNRLQGRVKALEDEKEVNTYRAEEENRSEPIDQVKSLNDKLTATTLKLFEIKNVNKQLKNDVKTATRLLSQEIGESFTSIQQLSGATSGWRGRAQQILSLQQRVQELQERTHSTNGGVAERDVNMLRQIETNRKHAHEQLSRELQASRTQCDETKKKLEVARARSKMLENELGVLKSRVATLLEKSSHDDQLVQALTCRIDTADENLKEQLHKKQQAYEQLETDLKKARNEIIKENLIRERVKRTLEERETEIKRLTAKRERSGARSSGEEDDTRTVCACKKSVQQQESRIANKVIEAERIRLLELVAVLNTRVDAARASLTKKELDLKRERQRNAKLQVTLAKLELGNKMDRNCLYTRSNRSVDATSAADKIDSNEISKNQLELSEEHNLLLRERLEALKAEKQMDVENFSKIAEMSKKIIRDEIVKLKSEMGCFKAN